MFNKKSLCCGAPMLSGMQCEACGADGRENKDLDAVIEKFYRYSFKQRRELYLNLIEERTQLKKKAKTAWSESERVAKYKRIVKINRVIWVMAKYAEAEKKTTYGKMLEVGQRFDDLKWAIKKEIKECFIIRFIKKLLRF